MTFNETVIMAEGYINNDWKIELEGPMTPYTVTYECVSAPILMVPTPNLTVWFTFEAEDVQFFGYESETMTFTFSDLNMIKSESYLFPMINKTVTFHVDPHESSETCGIRSLGIIVVVSSGLVVVIGLIGVLVGHSMVIAWQVIHLLQFVHFIPLMMIYTPSCVVEFCDSLGLFNAQFGTFGTYIINNIFPADQFNTNVDYKFKRAGFNTSAFITTGADIIVIWILIFTIIPVLMFLKVLFSNIPTIKEFEERFRKGMIFTAIMLTYQITCFSILLDLTNTNFENGMMYLSGLIA
jgi:hypothetical protein